MQSQKRRRRARYGSSVALAVAGVLVLGGCSASNGGSPSADDVTLNVWTWNADARAALEDVIIPKFEDANPGISVNVTQHPNENYETILTTGLAGSGSPDVVAVRAGILEGMALSESIVPLDDVVTSWDGFPEGILRSVSSRADGLIYAVPQGVQTGQMYYNRTIFEEHDLAVPQTWSEFLDLCRELEAAGVSALVVPGATVPQAALAAEIIGNARRGAGDFERAFLSGQVDMTHPDSIASLDLMMEIEPYLYPNSIATTLDEAVTLFVTGRAAMFPSGTWQVGGFASLGAEIDYGSFDVPVDPGWPTDEAVTVSWPDGGWALAARSENPDAAALLIDFMSTVEFADDFANEMGQLPARSGVALENEALAEMLERYEANPSTYLASTYLRFGSPTGTDLVGGLIQQLWLGQVTAEQAAQQYQDGLDAWFDPSDFAAIGG